MQPLARSARTSEANNKSSAAHSVIERLDAQRIARQKHRGCGAAATLRHFGDRKREHAAQFGDGMFAPLFIGVDDYFGIRARQESVAFVFQFLAQFAEIVNFAVVDDGKRTGFVPDGLRTAGKINDAEAARASDYGWGDENSLFIGAAMNDGGEHAADDGLGISLRVYSDGAADSAHGISSRNSRTRCRHGAIACGCAREGCRGGAHRTSAGKPRAAAGKSPEE